MSSDLERRDVRDDFTSYLQELILAGLDGIGSAVDVLGLVEGEFLAVRERLLSRLQPALVERDPTYDEDPNPVFRPQFRSVERVPSPTSGPILSEHVAMVLPYSREELERIRTIRVGFVGLGSSQICASILARSGVERFTLIDADQFEASNVRQEFCFANTLGKLKVEAGADLLRQINANIDVKHFPVRARSDNIAEMLEDADMVFSGVDNYASRVLVDAYCRSSGKPMLSVAFAGWEGRYFTTMKDDPPWEVTVKASQPTPNYGTHPAGIAMLWAFAAADALSLAIGQQRIVKYPMMLCVNLRRLSPVVLRDARNIFRNPAALRSSDGLENRGASVGETISQGASA